jgi:putative ABC transport system permease protein
MVSPRWRKVWRDLWSNKTRTFLVILSIAVGVFAVGLVATAQAALASELTASYLASNPADLTLMTTPFDEEMLKAIRRMRDTNDVSVVEGRRLISARVRLAPNQWRTLQLVALADFGDIRINQVHPERGTWPPGKREVLLERSSLRIMNVAVGEAIEIELSDGTQRRLRVAGLVHDLKLPAFLTNTVSGYITQDTAEWLGEPRTFNELNALITGSPHDKAHVEQLAQHITDRLETGGGTVLRTLTYAPGKYPLDNIIQAMVMILGVLGVLALGLSGFLVTNTVSALMTQQVKQIGVMKALGARTGQIVAMFLVLILAFGLLALVVAIPLSVIGARAIVGYIAELLNFSADNLEAPQYVLALQVAVGLLVPLIAGSSPVMQGTRISVREATASYGITGGSFGDSRLDRLVESVHWLSRPLLLSLRNTVRRKTRLVLTVATLTFGGAIFIAVLSVRVSTLRTADEAFNRNYDIEVTLSRPYRTQRLISEAESIPGVVNAESWLTGEGRRVRADGKVSPPFALLALPPQSQMLRPPLREGRWLLSDDERALVINTDILKEEPDLAVGSELVLKLRGEESTWRVVGIITGQMMGGLAYANYADYMRQVGAFGRGNRLVVQAEQHDSLYQANVGRMLEAGFKRVGLRVSDIQTTAEIRSLVASHWNVIITLLLIMATILGIVGGLGLMGTMSLNVIERTREIGVLRAVGASDSAVVQIVMTEGVLIAAFSWVSGSMLSIPISKLLSDAVGRGTIQVPLSYSFSIGGAVLWLALVIIVAVAASALPAWRASRLTIREVLAYE